MAQDPEAGMTPDENNNDVRTGLIAGLAAYTMWGFLPIYFKVLGPVAATEVLAHRIIWAVPVGALILTFRNQWPEVRKAFSDWRALRGMGITAAFIAVNWGVYIWTVQTDRIFQASLGYYINPLMFVLVGVFVNREVLRRGQIAAVALAAIGVSVLTIYGGVFPWISFVLAISFTFYGYLRKTVQIGAMPGLFIETIWLVLPAIAFWLWLEMQGTSAFTPDAPGTIGLLLLAGPLTVIPLLFFAISARRLRLSTIGFMQFLGPTLQFCVGLYYGETFTTAHAICFGFIWVAVIVFSLDALAAGRRPKRVAEPA
uniref:Chloramphenicol resistance permease RarD n=2 Tax=Aquisalinus luteolus TaxID=1566827 RepID=A0A8J3A0I1_9PROT|nr:chloramphenicol resistance permease RarD [Aquisalinus luteolus]